MPWALVKHWKGNEIVRKSDRKYDLLKWGIETKEPVSKKTISSFKDGDQVTVIYRSRYQKSFHSNELRLYKDWVNESNEVTYTLKEFRIEFKKMK